jgi:hypothetical protein
LEALAFSRPRTLPAVYAGLAADQQQAARLRDMFDEVLLPPRLATSDGLNSSFSSSN